jgi:hypothetical protein
LVTDDCHDIPVNGITVLLNGEVIQVGVVEELIFLPRVICVVGKEKRSPYNFNCIKAARCGAVILTVSEIGIVPNIASVQKKLKQKITGRARQQ